MSRTYQPGDIVTILSGRFTQGVDHIAGLVISHEYPDRDDAYSVVEVLPETGPKPFPYTPDEIEPAPVEEGEYVRILDPMETGAGVAYILPEYVGQIGVTEVVTAGPTGLVAYVHFENGGHQMVREDELQVIEPSELPDAPGEDYAQTTIEDFLGEDDDGAEYPEEDAEAAPDDVPVVYPAGTLLRLLEDGTRAYSAAAGALAITTADHHAGEENVRVTWTASQSNTQEDGSYPAADFAAFRGLEAGDVVAFAPEGSVILSGVVSQTREDEEGTRFALIHLAGTQKTYFGFPESDLSVPVRHATIF